MKSCVFIIVIIVSPISNFIPSCLLSSLQYPHSLLVSCGGLSKETAKIWVEVGGLSAITSAVESHSVFVGGGDDDVLPAMLFGLSMPLLLYMKEDEKHELATTTDAGAEKTSRAAREHLVEVFLRLLVERREWVARSLRIAANTSRSDVVPVTINNILVNSLAHEELLGPYVGTTPVRLRAQAVKASRTLETEGRFAPGFAEKFARLLGLGGQQVRKPRVATGPVGTIKGDKCSRLSCGKREANAGKKFKVCSRCQSAFYCSENCQGAHWKEGHREMCRKMASTSLGARVPSARCSVEQGSLM